MDTLFEKKRKSSVTTLFSLVLYILFTVLSLTLVFTGVKAYQRTTQISLQNEQIRSSVNYVTNKIKTATGDISLVQYGDVTVLAIREEKETYNNNENEESKKSFYYTNIYFFNGYICETMSNADFAFDPELGETIVNASDFTFELMDNNYIIITAKDEVFGNAVSTGIYREKGFRIEVTE